MGCKQCGRKLNSSIGEIMSNDAQPIDAAADAVVDPAPIETKPDQPIPPADDTQPIQDKDYQQFQNDLSQLNQYLNSIVQLQLDQKSDVYLKYKDLRDSLKARMRIEYIGLF